MLAFIVDAWLRRIVPFLLVVVVGIWLTLTPGGLLGKLDAIGYAVCHRLPEHSLFLGERALPLCARCSGMYLGVAIGLGYLLPRSRKAAFPPRRVLACFGLVLSLFALDGVNSFVELATGSSWLYSPQNWLRTITGGLLGIAMAAILVPAFAQTVWSNYSAEPALGTVKTSFGLAGASLLAGGLLLFENPLLEYPLAVISALAVPVFLILIHTTIWAAVLKRWNTYGDWKALIPLLTLAGLTVAAQILGVDLVRYSLTGTWAGFLP